MSSLSSTLDSIPKVRDQSNSIDIISIYFPLPKVHGYQMGLSEAVKKQYAPLFAPDSDEDNQEIKKPPLDISDSEDSEENDFPTNRDPLAISSSRTKSTLGKDNVYINVFGGGMPGCYVEWLQSNSPILKSTLPKYATYQAALDEWRQYCESQHEHPADFINGTAYSPHTSQITRLSAATPRMLTDHQERVVLSPPPTTSLSGVSTLSDASDSSDNLVGPKAKERCWAIHTPEGLINEIVTGHWADRLFENATRIKQDTIMCEVKCMREAKRWFSEISTVEIEWFHWAIHTHECN
ncbi:hypothetical protein BT96DRAFT_949270 [Gymnopus androsaceus JB14]|uniref:Uncharacterized protein n=1 Tax=Gymnopus androsaceus JB14 TaxID=1447944 RepID=A0A6A4GLK2_9AGAR|nr:hypothetical protein BT96DRAFT_949270 [Gymnopus androsaceus JB14]